MTSSNHSDWNQRTRRWVLRGAASIGIVGTAGCGNQPAPQTDTTPTATPTQDRTATQTTEQFTVGTFHMANDIDYWAWYPENQELWSRSAEPYDFSADEGDGRWLAEPVEEGVRCRVENDNSPGNAGFYIDVGPVGEITSITVESESVQSDGSEDQQLLVALYFDASDDGEYFRWDNKKDRESFLELGGDVEALGFIPADKSYTIDGRSELDLVPPLEEELVSLETFKKGLRGEVTPLTQAALQVSVVGSGAGNTEEAVITDVTVEKEPPFEEFWWPMFSYDHANRGHKQAAVGPTDEIETDWTFETGGTVRSSPATAHGTVYVGSEDGNVYAVDAGTGEEAWRFETGGAVVSSPAVRGHVVYVGSNDTRVYALNAHTGEEIWAFETGDHVRSSPTVEAGGRPGGLRVGGIGDVVVIGSDDGKVYILDAVTGNSYKTVSTGGPVVAAPMILYTPSGFWEISVGSTDGNTYAWLPDPPNIPDDVVRDADAGAPIYAAMSFPAGLETATWYRANDDGILSKLVRTTTPTWTFEAAGKIRTTPVLADDAVYIGSWDGYVYGVDQETGQENWSFETDGKVNSSPAVEGEVLYVGSADQQVYALDTGTGERRWAFETDGPVHSSPAVVDGTVYVGSDDGRVYALADASS